MNLRKSTFVLPILAIACLVFAAVLVSGCASSPGTTPTTTTIPPITTPAIQKITVTGSTTVLPLADKEKEAFQANNSYADIQTSGGGSSVGVKAAGEGTADIGMSSRDLSADEIAAYPTLVKQEIVYDAVVLIVNSGNPVESLTLTQIRGIYNGTYTNWNQVGGSNQVIVPVGRDSASGTRVYFADSVMKNENFTPNMQEFNSNGGVQQQVTQTPGAIGYVGLSYTSGVKALKINVNGTAVAPSIVTVSAGTYPISRPLFMLTKGQPTGLAKQFIDFILSPAGQQIAAENGFVPLP
jgi:phosphate transport system substrate-binding protein